MKTKVNQLRRMTLLVILTTSLTVTQYSRAQIPQERIKRGIWKGEEIEYVDRKVSIKVKPGVGKAQLIPSVEMLRGRFLEEIDVLRWTVIELPERVDVFDAIGVLEKNPLIEKAIPVGTIYTHVLPNDPYFRGTSPATYPHQWGLRNTGQSPPGGTSGADIRAEQAWDITTGSSNVLLAILDSGIPLRASDLSLSHLDLNDANKIVLQSDYIFDGQGVRDRNGHGTHVAGIAAAMTNNGEGIAGVSWNSRILVYQVFDSLGFGTWPAFRNATRDAVDYQRNNPGQRVVVNFSGGGSFASPDAEDAVSYANQYGVAVIVSAGNTPRIVEWPARYSLTYLNVIAVAATDQNDNRSGYSGQGSALNVAAPGGYGGSPSADDIFSTTPNYPFYWESQGVGRTYGHMAGTSMAAPHVAGVAALMLSVNPSMTPSEIRNTLEQTADDKGPTGFDTDFGHGRINAYRAVKASLPQQFVNATFNSNTTLGYSRFQGTTTIATDVTITVEAGKALVIEGTVNGGTSAHIRAYGNLIIEPGVSINNVRVTIESGARIVANGTASQRITLTSTSGSWQGISFNSAASSNLTYCDILYATMPIKATNTSNLTISNVTIGNSSFYNGTDNAAMAFYWQQRGS